MPPSHDRNTVHTQKKIIHAHRYIVDPKFLTSILVKYILATEQQYSYGKKLSHYSYMISLKDQYMLCHYRIPVALAQTKFNQPYISTLSKVDFSLGITESLASTTID